MEYKATIFCDIDGVLIEHENIPMYDDISFKVLDGTIDKINEWVANKYYIVLVTARKDTKLLKDKIKKSGIKYNKLITKLPSCPRHIINDRKPSNKLKPQTSSYEVYRNEGISNITIPNGNIEIVKKLTGGSFAETSIISNDGNLFIRKIISKRSNIDLGYKKLKTQYLNMKNISYINNTYVPNIFNENDDSYEYYYDLEYLDKYTLLFDIANKAKYINLLHIMLNDIYNYSNIVLEVRQKWLYEHLDTKITSKLSVLQNNSIKFFNLINSNSIYINDIEYTGLNNMLLNIKQYDWITPEKLSIIHGDLTFENILVFEDDVKLIDIDSDERFCATELDLGKLFQSIISGYETWKNIDVKIEYVDDKIYIEKYNIIEENIKELVLNNWSDILNVSYDIAHKKAMFYLSLHLIRMIPFRLKVNEDQALYALILAVECMNQSFNL